MISEFWYQVRRWIKDNSGYIHPKLSHSLNPHNRVSFRLSHSLNPSQSCYFPVVPISKFFAIMFCSGFLFLLVCSLSNKETLIWSYFHHWDPSGSTLVASIILVIKIPANHRGLWLQMLKTLVMRQMIWSQWTLFSNFLSPEKRICPGTSSPILLTRNDQ